MKKITPWMVAMMASATVAHADNLTEQVVMNDGVVMKEQYSTGLDLTGPTSSADIIAFLIFSGFVLIATDGGGGSDTTDTGNGFIETAR